MVWSLGNAFRNETFADHGSRYLCPIHQRRGTPRAEAFCRTGHPHYRGSYRLSALRYEDRTVYRPLHSLQDNEWALTRGQVCSVGGFDSRRGFGGIGNACEDGTGSVVLKFFNQPYLRDHYRQGMNLVIYGQVKRDAYFTALSASPTRSVKCWKKNPPLPPSIRGAWSLSIAGSDPCAREPCGRSCSVQWHACLRT